MNIMATDLDEILDTIDDKPQSPKDKIHMNLKIGFAALGIIGFGLSILVSYYTLKNMKK
jgi:hypothetical protein